MTPASATVTALTQKQFTAAISGSANPGVDWKIEEGEAGGLIVPSGLYTAPAGSGAFHVIATSQADPSKFATSLVTVVSAPRAEITAPTHVTAGQSGQVASVLEQPGMTYAWTIQGGTIASGAAGPVIAFSGGAVGNIRLECTVTNQAGTTQVGTKNLDVVASPIATVNAPDYVTAELTGWKASVASQPGMVYIWSIVGGLFVGSSAGSEVIFTPGHSGTVRIECTVINPAGTASNGSKLLTIVAPPRIVRFGISATEIYPGQNAVLTPEFSDGLGSIEPGFGSVFSGSPYSVQPNASTSYILKVGNLAGTEATATVGLVVNSDTVRIFAFEATPNPVEFGQASQLSWSISGRSTSLTLNGASVLGEPAWMLVSPLRRKDYVLSGSNPLGGETRTLSVATRGLTLLAGNADGPGWWDGAGSQARFGEPLAVAVDSEGNAYVADHTNHTIRKVSSAGVVTTLAGRAGSWGNADGSGSAARFHYPSGVAVDLVGNVYVTDSWNYTIRKISPIGSVSTLAGAAGVYGSNDGLGNVARFGLPTAISVDNAGNLYVTDSSSHTIRKVTPAGLVITLAGSAGLSGSADGNGSTARFNDPNGIVVDGTGIVYVADTLNHTIRRITPAGDVVTLAGQVGTHGASDGMGSAAQFNFPRGLALDGGGNLAIVDTNSFTIRKMATDGNVTTFAGLAYGLGSADGVGSSARFRFPHGIAASGGSLWIADRLNHTLRRIGSDATVTTLAGMTETTGAMDGVGETALFYLPLGVALDGAGNLIVADFNNGRLRLVTPSGVVHSPGAWTGLTSPHGVAMDGSGNLYLASFDHTIRKIAPDGAITILAGTPGVSGDADGTGTAARFSYPYGIAVAGDGTVYVADTQNYLVRKITPTGVVSTIAGQPGVNGHADGPGASASFSQPIGLAVDGAGIVYVTELGFCKIRRISPDGQVSTVAGSIPGFADGGEASALFFNPWGIAVDHSGNLFVADSGNHAIRKITPAGVVSTVVGHPQKGGVQTGSFPGGLFTPYGIAISPEGDLYISVPHGVVVATAP